MEKWRSRKLWVALGAAAVTFVGAMWPDQEDLARQVVALAIGYMVAQGLVDAAHEVGGRGEQR